MTSREDRKRKIQEIQEAEEQIRVLEARIEEVCAPLQKEVDAVEERRAQAEGDLWDSPARDRMWLSKFLDNVLPYTLKPGTRKGLWTTLFGFLTDVSADEDEIQRKHDTHGMQYTFSYLWRSPEREKPIKVCYVVCDFNGYSSIESHPEFDTVFAKVVAELGETKYQMEKEPDTESFYTEGLATLPHFLWPATLVALANYMTGDDSFDGYDPDLPNEFEEDDKFDEDKDY